MKFATNTTTSLPEFDLSNSRVIQKVNGDHWIPLEFLGNSGDDALEFVSRIQVMTKKDEV